MGTFLRQTRLVFVREARALLTHPLLYVLTGVFFLLTAQIYITILTNFAKGSEDATVNVTDSVIRPIFQSVHFFLIVQIPLLTMRVFSEDRSSGMLDLLQTTPASDWAITLGKFGGALAAMFFYLALTFAFPLTTAMLGDVEWPVVIGSVIALILSTSAYVSIGVFFSAITESQVVASVLSYVALFLLIFAQPLADSQDVPAISDAIKHFAVLEHINGLLSGDIVLMNLVYFIVITAIGLFCTARIVEARRWRA
ncbi:ABC transporter permease [soil metagenome]